MRVRHLFFTLAFTLVIACIAAPASADGFVSPYLGANFGNPSGDGRINFGTQLGWIGGAGFGFELDLGYAPNFFGSQSKFGSNSVATVMGNVVIGGASGPQAGARPYVSAGGGFMRETVNGVGGASSIGHNDGAINLGGGVMGFVTDRVGLRGDIRYFRDLKDTGSANDFNIDFGSFHFWRGSFGVVLRF